MFRKTAHTDELASPDGCASSATRRTRTHGTKNQNAVDNCGVVDLVNARKVCTAVEGLFVHV